jgi:hypothetical protein
MSVNIEASDAMLLSLDSLRTTALPMHKLYFELSSVDQWYIIIREAQAQFGKNWRGQRHVKRRLEHASLWRVPGQTERVWFEVPDLKFGTWISIKHAVRQVESPGK